MYSYYNATTTSTTTTITTSATPPIIEAIGVGAELKFQMFKSKGVQAGWMLLGALLGGVGFGGAWGWMGAV